MEEAYIDQLVERVYTLLAQRMAQDNPPAGQARVLLLSDRQEPAWQALLSRPALEGRCATRCASEEAPGCCDGYDTVVLYHLSNDTLAKITRGVCDTPYTSLVSQAILSGKRILIPREEIEFYRYADTAPPPYFNMLEGRLRLLTCAGAILCAPEELVRVILEENTEQREPTETKSSAEVPPAPTLPPVVSPPSQNLTKRLITEKDVCDAAAQRIGKLIIGAKSIVTALARDCAAAKGITLVRE